ncbi:CLIP domain-containing serine protease B4-like isoform X1 [Onthophagus taurus]|uniref:CLIP domain-containing serine protease B4-like isoform X1 n=1 Tax=Onthophagus taurus TaxID=166361 RepID=UPI0039BDC783
MSNIYILLTCFIFFASAKNKTNRIIGGTYTSISNYPYHAVLEYWGQNRFEYLCGGALITWNHVLTAGHCCKDFQADKFRVLLGFDDYYNQIPNQMSNVNQIFVHPSYHKILNEPIHDIAILKLTSQISPTKTVNVIRLPAFGSYPSSQYLSTITGFGKTKSSNSQPSPYLMKADVKIINNDVCLNAVKSLVPTSNPSIGANNFCTMDTPTKGSCSGDSGGPLMQFGEIIGVISWGVSPCDLNNNPTVYTRVAAYVDWIQNVVQL